MRRSGFAVHLETGRGRRPRRAVWWVAAAVLGVVIAGVVGVSAYVGWNLSHAERRPVNQTPLELGLAYESVEFASSDGVTLRGWFLPADDDPSRTIILAHGFRSNRLTPSLPALELARSLVASGFNVLMFDFRNSGESDGDVTTLGDHERKDIVAAVQWLKRERADRAERLGLIGFSMGATTALLAAASEPAIEAVVADSPFSDLRSYLKANMSFWTGLPEVPFTWTIMAIMPPLINLDVRAVSPLAVMPELAQPVLLIHAEGDDAIPARESEILAAAGNPERTELWVAPGTKHLGARQVDPAAYDARVVRFFNDALGTTP